MLTGGAGSLRVGLVTSSGRTDWLPTSELVGGSSAGHSTLRIDLTHPVAAGGIVVEAAHAPTPVTLGTPTASTTQTGEVALNGRMQYGVTPGHWVFIGTIGSFGVFHNTRAHGWAWVGGSGSGGGSGSASSAGAAPIDADPPSENGDQQITVQTSSATILTRSESWSTGWKATVQPVASSSGNPPTGPARSVPVFRLGLEQAVRLPAKGEYLVTFRYRPAAAEVGMALTAVSGAGLLLWGLVELWIRRRRVRAAVGGGSANGSELSAD